MSETSVYQEIICMGNTLPWLSNDTEVDHARPTDCALAAPPPIDGNHSGADTGAEKGTISLDAQRRPLHARVGRLFEIGVEQGCGYQAFTHEPDDFSRYQASVV